MYLYFEHSNGSLSFISECAEDDVWQYITQCVKQLNPNYQIYYVRSWGDKEHGYTYDIGSHTEFFHLYKERLSES